MTMRWRGIFSSCMLDLLTVHNVSYTRTSIPSFGIKYKVYLKIWYTFCRYLRKKRRCRSYATREENRERGSRIGKRSRRRRGDVLIESIYQATEEALKEDGYTNLTFQKIAQMTRRAAPCCTAAGKLLSLYIREIMVYKKSESVQRRVHRQN